MADLTADRHVDHREPAHTQEFPIEAAAKVYKGAQLIVNSDGFVQPGAALASNKGFTVIATHQADIPSGNGDEVVKCYLDGLMLLVGSSFTQGSIGTLYWSVDDQTIGATATNLAKCGISVEFVSATEQWVSLGAGLFDPNVGA